MRGKVGSPPQNGHGSRITPAYAGKRRKAVHGKKWERDHPRLCGEKKLCRSLLTCNPGSPPPMRGKGTATPTDDTYFRITPAYAGKSQCNNHDVIFKQDHPRLCGEKETIKVGQVTGTGSPPPMRGKVDLFSAGMRLIRITPAYAGKSHSLKPLLLFNLGSPPPMRGKVAIPA